SAGGAPRSAKLFRGPGAVALDGGERALAAQNRRREVCLPADTGARKSAAIGAQANGANLFRRLDRVGSRGFVVESQAQTGRTGSALGADRTGAKGRSLMNHWQLPIELTLKGIMILAAAGLLSVGLRNASAASRHVVWSLALGALLLLPVLTWAVPAWRVAILPAPPAPPAPVAENASLDTETSAAVAERLPLAMPNQASIEAVVAPQFESATAPLAAAAPAWQFNPARIALLIWAAGALLLLARLLLGTMRMRRITRDANRLIDYPWSMLTNRLRGQLDISDHVSIYVSEEVYRAVRVGVVITI